MIEVERLPWADFLASWRWKQGEHVTLLGPTGQGKTTLALEVIPRRRYVIVFGTKAKDKTLDRLIKQDGFIKVDEWPPPPYAEKIILWPSLRKSSYRLEQQRVFHEALNDIYSSGGWAVYLDELRYICDTLKLSAYVENLWQQGRSLGISVIGGNQRPRFVPLNAYDQATHLFVWNFNDRENAKRLSEIVGINEKEIADVIRKLPKYDVLYINADTHRLAITNTKT